MELIDILNKTVSYQNSAVSDLSKELTILEILDEIRSSKHQARTSRLRELLSNGDKEEYKLEKRKLPAVTFCATFHEKRRKEKLKNYNHVIVIDIDNLDAARLEEVKTHLVSDEFIVALWESPSRNGLKGLMHVLSLDNEVISDVNQFHSTAFDTVVKYLLERYAINLDRSGSDTTRLCFLSHDKDLHLKTSHVPFLVDPVDVFKPRVPKSATPRKQSDLPMRRLLFHPDGKNQLAKRESIQSIIRYLSKRKLSITHSYNKWYRVAYAIADTFTYEIGEKYFIKLSKLDPDKYDESECKTMLINAYKRSNGSIRFKTIVYFAEEIGYKVSNQRASTEGD